MFVKCWPTNFVKICSEVMVFVKPMFDCTKFYHLILTFIFLVSSFVLGQDLNIRDCPDKELADQAQNLENLLNQKHPSRIILKADSLLIANNDTECLAIMRLMVTKAIAYEKMLDFENALLVYHKIINIARKHDYSKLEADTHLTLAAIYEHISRPKRCEEQLFRAKKLIDRHGYQDLLSRYYIRYASYIRIYEHDLDKVAIYARKAIELGTEYNVTNSITDGYLLLGMASLDLEDAICYYSLAANLFFQNGDINGGMYQNMNIAKIYVQKGQLDKALSYIDSVEDNNNHFIDNEKKYHEFQKAIALKRAEIYEAQGDNEKVVEALKDYIASANAFGDVVNQDKINQLLLDNAIEQEREKIKASNRLYYLLIGSLILLSLIVIILGRLYWLNRRKSRKIKDQTTTIKQQYCELESLYEFQTTLLSEVHHRINNNLQLIISLIILQNAKLNQKIPPEVISTLAHRIRSVALIHEQLYKAVKFDKADVETYVQNLLHNFMSLMPTKQIKGEYHINKIQFNLETLTPIGLILSELISNSLKCNDHSDKINIYIEFTEIRDNKYRLHYHDNGKGYPEGGFSPNDNGMGFMIIHSLVRQLSGTAEAYNSNGAHYVVTFQEKKTSK